jgi:hypothetical protein
MTTLNTRDKNFCNYTGFIGILLTLTSIIQLFVIAKEASVITWIFGIYLFTLVAFSMLIAQHHGAPYLLISSTLGLLIVDIMVSRNGLFSLVIMLLFIYCTLVSLFVMMDGLHQRLWKRTLSQQAEEDRWRDKL